ncbi:DUF4236 domain-containing protein [Mucilaginibacter sp. CAU 1740]|uniref:DUF4236 domain-containing protein n=1 Tax=Mucilaginibacter sp. CAU 1740 TaxID=3140365 RepID=UPI00325BE5BD
MGWSYRKSLGSGPFRVSFSKSGISYSVGVKGARVNFGPKGTYVNLSSHGISYRQKISGSAQASSPMRSGNPAVVPARYELVHNIASASIGQLTETDSKGFIDELSQTASKNCCLLCRRITPPKLKTNVSANISYIYSA